jgi:hypothetical protein
MYGEKTEPLGSLYMFGDDATFSPSPIEVGKNDGSSNIALSVLSSKKLS